MGTPVKSSRDMGVTFVALLLGLTFHYQGATASSLEDGVLKAAKIAAENFKFLMPYLGVIPVRSGAEYDNEFTNDGLGVGFGISFTDPHQTQKGGLAYIKFPLPRELADILENLGLLPYWWYQTFVDIKEVDIRLDYEGVRSVDNPLRFSLKYTISHKNYRKSEKKGKVTVSVDKKENSIKIVLKPDEMFYGLERETGEVEMTGKMTIDTHYRFNITGNVGGTVGAVIIITKDFTQAKFGLYTHQDDNFILQMKLKAEKMEDLSELKIRFDIDKIITNSPRELDGLLTATYSNGMLNIMVEPRGNKDTILPILTLYLHPEYSRTTSSLTSVKFGAELKYDNQSITKIQTGLNIGNRYQFSFLFDTMRGCRGYGCHYEVDAVYIPREKLEIKTNIPGIDSALFERTFGSTYEARLNDKLWFTVKLNEANRFLQQEMQALSFTLTWTQDKTYGKYKYDICRYSPWLSSIRIIENICDTMMRLEKHNFNFALVDDVITISFADDNRHETRIDSNAEIKFSLTDPYNGQLNTTLHLSGHYLGTLSMVENLEWKYTENKFEAQHSGNAKFGKKKNNYEHFANNVLSPIITNIKFGILSNPVNVFVNLALEAAGREYGLEVEDNILTRLE